MSTPIRLRPSRGQGNPFVPSLLCAALAGAAAVAIPSPAAAAPPESARVSVTSAGVSYTGTSGPDTVVITRAGTAAAPLLHIDGSAPVIVGAGCTVAADNTRALCTAPKLSSGQLRGFQVATLGGDDSVANGAVPAVAMAATLGAGNDTANGGAGDDSLNGESGDDRLRGLGGDDTMAGSVGNDQLDGGAGFDDDLFGGAGADTLLGGPGNGDDLDGGAGADTLDGGDGGAGADTLDGGDGGTDTLLYDARTGNVSVNLLTGVAGEAGENDKVVGGFEATVLGNGNDSFTGSDQRDVVLGRAGDDILQGNRGSDTLAGEGGSDFLISGPTQIFAPGPPNSDGVPDELDGGDATDTCIPSKTDNDLSIDCESVIPFE